MLILIEILHYRLEHLPFISFLYQVIVQDASFSKFCMYTLDVFIILFIYLTDMT
jgi:hypothetical protein